MGIMNKDEDGEAKSPIVGWEQGHRTWSRLRKWVRVRHYASCHGNGFYESSTAVLAIDSRAVKSYHESSLGTKSDFRQSELLPKVTLLEE